MTALPRNSNDVAKGGRVTAAGNPSTPLPAFCFMLTDVIEVGGSVSSSMTSNLFFFFFFLKSLTMTLIT